MTNGFLLGLGIGVVTAWFFYWRIVRLFARIGFAKESVWRNSLGRATYNGLVEMRKHVDLELARRQAPSPTPETD